MLQRKSLTWFDTPTGINNGPVDRFTLLHMGAGFLTAQYLHLITKALKACE